MTREHFHIETMDTRTEEPTWSIGVAMDDARRCLEEGASWVRIEVCDDGCRHGDEVDDDPQCVCGVYRSEHAMMGCPEGFQTPKAWEAEKAFIAELDDHDFERIYGGEV